MSNDLVKKENQFVANAEAMDLQEEMQGLNVTFDRIKVPSGGGLAFEVPGENPDEPDLQKEFSAVILYHHPILSYYKEKYTGGSEAPDCSSMDGINGVDRESGELKSCKDCPLNQFGTGENGGKACKTKRRIFILRAGEAFPTLLTLPTASISDYSKYIMRLLSKGKKSNQVVTKFGLKKDSNKTGITFSKVTLGYERDLTEQELVNVKEMSEQVKSMASTLHENFDSEE